MRYFYIFILTLILISCNEKKGYGRLVEYGEQNFNVSVSECRDANSKGNFLGVLQSDQSYSTIIKIVYYKGYVYRIQQFYDYHTCNDKRKYHDKWIGKTAYPQNWQTKYNL